MRADVVSVRANLRGKTKQESEVTQEKKGKGSEGGSGEGSDIAQGKWREGSRGRGAVEYVDMNDVVNDDTQGKRGKGSGGGSGEESDISQEKRGKWAGGGSGEDVYTLVRHLLDLADETLCRYACLRFVLCGSVLVSLSHSLSLFL